MHGLLGQRAKAPKAVVASVAPGGEAAHQGEGYIEGTYDEYKVRRVDDHRGFRYARLRCGNSAQE